MSIPLWGQLQKAQDDPETIEQAIARMIVEHEEDPTAHLGEGESLSMHKHEAVIDHPASSLVADKYSGSEFFLRTQFESLDAWSKGGEYFSGVPGLVITAIDGDNDRTYVFGTAEGLQGINLLSREMIFQESFNANGVESTTYIMFGMGLASVSPSSAYTGVGFYFYINNNDLFARVKSSTTTSDVEITGIDFTVPHVYRAHYTPYDGYARFYIDDVQVAQIAKPSGSYFSGWGYHHWIQDTSDGHETNGYFYDLFFSFSILTP